MEYFLLQPVTGKGSIHATTVIYIWINQLLPTSPASEDTRLARQQHYRAVRIAEKISSVCKVTFLL